MEDISLSWDKGYDFVSFLLEPISLFDVLLQLDDLATLIVWYILELF